MKFETISSCPRAEIYEVLILDIQPYKHLIQLSYKSRLPRFNNIK
jgi:hypothetical protein